MAKRMEKLNKIRTAHIWANPRRCTACWKCVDACPKQVINKIDLLWHKHVTIKNAAGCIGCKKCIQACPNGVFSEKISGLLKNHSVKKRNQSAEHAMKISQKKSFDMRKFVSVGLFFTLTSLVITGILIQTFELFENEFPAHFCTAVHVLTGFVFTVFSIFHIVLNWRSLKRYIKKTDETNISKESVVALFLTVIIIVIVYLLAGSLF